VRLADLDPQWLMFEGRRVGFTFISPAQRIRRDGTVNPTPYRQTCFAERVPFRDQLEIFEAMFGVPFFVQGCNPECAWTVAGGIDQASFETMTVTPSLDGSAGGLWHGFISNGDIVGGV
jgi:hypothetical protein